MKVAQITMRTALAILFSMLMLASVVNAGEVPPKVPPKKDAAGAPAVHNNDAESMRLQGEQRFHANCSRCHAAPEKFPPRVMGTVIRHMRVRATITDADMKLILFYMTQ